MKERNFALYVSLGIEIRNFIFGGIYEKLKELGNCYIFSCKQSEILENLCNENNLELIYLPIGEVIQNKRNKGEDKFLSARRARLRLSGVKTFQLSSESPNLRFKDYIIGNFLMYNLFERINYRTVNSHYYSDGLANHFSKYKITDIILQGYASPEVLTAAITASKQNINIWVINWGWKDFYINEYFNFKPEGFFTWSETLKNLYIKFNKNLKNSNVHVVGNISYDKMIENKSDSLFSKYRIKYNLPTDSKVILYTLLNPVIYKNEEDIVELIVNQSTFPENLYLMIKPNPMDKNWIRFYELEKKYKQVRIMENLWIFDEKNNFNMITTEGVQEWENMLNFCEATINVPSTVTIESLICRKPVINPLYDETNKINHEFSRLYDSSFYENVRGREDVVKCSSVEETINILKRILNNEIVVENSIENICVVGSALEKFYEKVSTSCKK